MSGDMREGRSTEVPYTQITVPFDHDSPSQGRTHLCYPLQHHYEEITQTLTCPTCKGKGAVPRDQETALVALIPYNDKRLKPKRTKLKVAVAVLLCFILAFLSMFFLFPRNISAHLTNTTTIQSRVQGTHIFVNLQLNFSMSNSNYVPATIQSYSVQALDQDQIVGSHDDKGQSQSIGTRSTTTFVATLNVTLVQLIVYCKYLDIPLNFQATFQMSYLFHSEMVTNNQYFYINCNPTPPTTTSPPTTAAATTTAMAMKTTHNVSDVAGFDT